MPKAISNLAVGDLVEISVNEANRARFGDTIVWRVVAKNHTGYPSNSVTLMANKIIQVMAIDAKEADNLTSTIKTHGNNRYIYSNMHQWLNSAKTSEWFTAQHFYDVAPISTTITQGNHYNDWPGFLTILPTEFTDKLLTTTLTVAKSSTFEGGGSDSFEAKMYLASTTEVGIGLENGIAEGAPFAAFTNNDSRVAYPTYHAGKNCNGYMNEEFNEYYPWQWALRSLNPTTAVAYRSIVVSGGFNTAYACSGISGIRPVCNIPSDTCVSDSPNNFNVYTLLPNQAPEAPAGITVPASIQGGSAAPISWGTSEDADSNLTGYRLERDNGNTAWTQIYQGSSTSFNDAISTNWDTVQYRVKAYDAYGAESGYTVSPTRVVSKNSAPGTPPEISVPSNIRGGSAVTVSWGVASDPEGNVAGYILERSLNGGSYIEVYIGAAASYADFVEFGVNSVAYRVKAYDSSGLESAYMTSAVRTVVNNRPPETPLGISLPMARAGLPLTITWGDATDPDGNLAGYILERSIDGAEWAQAYQGTQNAHTDQAFAGWTTVQYRVRAYDSLGDESANLVSGIRVVKKSPSAPAELHLPNKVISEIMFRIEWEKAISFEGGAISYCLERSENGKPFAPIYTGEASFFDDQADASAVKLQYRVKTIDSAAGESAATTSPEISVIHSKPPMISGEDIDLGQQNGPFSYSYSVIDPDGDAITVTESVDGQTVRTFTPTPGIEQSFLISSDALLLLSNGGHVLSVKVEDTHGLSATRIIHFSKNLHQMKVMPSQPIEFEATPSRVVVRVERSIPKGALYAVEATNNPFDPEPIWENITFTSERGLAHVFQNKTAVSGKHGLNIRVSAARNGAEGECWISKIDGGFE